MRKLFILSFVLFIGMQFVFGQDPDISHKVPTVIPPSPTVAALMKFEEVGISNYTGVPQVAFPLYSIKLGSSKLSLNLSLDYQSGNTKIDDVASDVGLGWSLTGLGTISRTVKDKPDETFPGPGGNHDYGVYRADALDGINYYDALDVINNSSTDYETYRAFVFDTNIKGKYDKEHDLWQYNFMGHSGKFYIEKDSLGVLRVKTLDNTTLKIINHYNLPSSGSVTSHYIPTGFTVYDDLGYKYIFDVAETTNARVFSETVSHYNNVTNDTTDEYTYKSAFHLSKVYDQNDNLLLDVSYHNGGVEQIISNSTVSATTSFDIIHDVNLIMSCSTHSLGYVLGLYKPASYLSRSTREYTPKKLDSITIPRMGKIKFVYDEGREDENYFNNEEAEILKSITVEDVAENVVKKIELEQSYIEAVDKKMFLTGITQKSGSDTLELYSFEYKEPVGIATQGKDAWGYLKSVTALDQSKETDLNNVDAFALEKIKWPTGGSTAIDYESNTYSYIGSEAITDFNENLQNWYTTGYSPQIDSLDTPETMFTIAHAINKVVIMLPEVSGLSNWRFNIYKNGSLFDTFTLENESHKVEYTNVATGNYTIELKSLEVGNDPFENTSYVYTGSAYVDYIVETGYKNYLYGGGYRVKSIRNFTHDADLYNNPGTPASEKHYNYDLFAEPGSSSGSLNSPKPVFAYYCGKVRPEIRSGCQGGHVMQLLETDILYYEVSSNDIISRNPTKGAEIGYKNVSVSQTGNGKTNYTYSSPIDEPDIEMSSGYCQQLPPISNDYRRGLVQKEEIYNQSGYPLKSVENHYTIIDLEATTGMYVFGLYHTASETNPVYKYFNSYNEYKYAKDNHHCTTGTGGFPYCGVDFGSLAFADDLDIGHNLVVENYGWAKLTSKTTKDYFYPTSSITPQNMVETNETYTYHDNNKQVDEKTVTNSLGETLKTKYYYHTGNSPYSDNRISEIEKIETFRGSDLLSTSKIVYSDSFSGNDSFLPQTIQTAKAAGSPEDRVQFNCYDEFGNPLELQQADGTKVCYIWGYNKTQPVAKIENIAYSSIPSGLIGAIQIESDAVDIDASDTFSAQQTELQGLQDALDDLRTDSALSEAMVTTYAYIPLVGAAIITDPKGDKITYEYDAFKRLKAVRDADGHLLSENDYHYLVDGDPINSVQTTVYKKPTTTPFSSPSVNDVVINKSFFDGLGRPIQQIAHKQAANGNDIVTVMEYDAYGRQAKEYLPYVNTSPSLVYNEDAKTELEGYSDSSVDYTAEPPVSEKVFESSPLNRVLEQGAPGTSWQITPGHTIKFDYQTNADNEVKKYTAAATYNSTTKLYDIVLAEDGHYDRGELYKTITKNENWVSSDGDDNTTQEFKDKEGHVVLKRTFGVSEVGGSSTDTNHDTYYVYDQYGNLTYVIPPLADGTVDQDILDDLCYQYKYDSRNRLAEKKLPGRQWEYMVYDKLDRVVATAPAMSPFVALNEGWMHTKYDAFGRVVLTAWSEGAYSSGDRKDLQDHHDSATVLSESRSSSPTTINGVSFDYTSVAEPASGYEVLTVNYYDDYDFAGAPTVPATVMDDNSQDVYYNNTLKPKGLATGNWVRVLYNSTPLYDLSYMLYDSKARVVRTHTDNYLTGYTQTDQTIDFAGKVTYSETRHKRTSADDEIYTLEELKYTAQDKVVSHSHQIGLGGTPEMLAVNTYSPLGQLTNKHVGGDLVNFPDGLQVVDYQYNIRGWLTDINDIDDLSVGSDPNDLFAFKINYNTVVNAVNYSGKELYNGNISETYWRSDSDNIKRKYGYFYDNLNRLNRAVYQKPNESVAVTNSYNESLTYDKNGNITYLERNGDLDTYLLPIGIDELTYSYDPDKKNQLMRVVDGTTHPAGFDDDNFGSTLDTTDDYTYDAYGNLTSDQNKGITSIVYNHLNLPVEIIFGGSRDIKYLYDATGKKVLKVVNDGTDVTTTDYLTGFQYETVNSGGAVLTFFPHAEGYVNNTVVDNVNVYNYVYNYTDHLGNIRVSYTYDAHDHALKIMEENHYYPFGLKHANYNAETWDYVKDENGEYTMGVVLQPVVDMGYQYKYNGKEYQNELNLNLYDYGARNYDPALGRWMNVDPLAEKMSGHSPYNYAFNNPVYFIDIDGMAPGDPIGPGYYSASVNSRMVGFIQRHPKIAASIGLPTKGSTNISTNSVRFSTRIGLFENNAKEGSQVNAFRHVLWQAQITAKYGVGIAKEVGNMHEENPTVATGRNLQTSFNTLAKADETVDLLNNIIGRKIGLANPDANMQELSILVLNEFKENGLWTASEIFGEEGEIIGYSISKTQLSSNMHTDALEILKSLNKNGYTKSEQQRIDEFWKRESERLDKLMNDTNPKF